MKLVAITRVKNEIDIVEAFVRHHARHFDKLIVLDDGSSDGTYQVLQQLQSIYCDLVLLRQPTIGYLQHRYMSLLLRMAVDKFGADWVLPLDADEFIEPNGGLMLAQVLAARVPAVYKLQWSNFVWVPELEQSDEQNPVLRQRLRLPPSVGFSKLLIHAQFVNATVELSLGNHILTYNGLPLAAEPLEGVKLCHYPVRSIAQYAGKIAVGYLQYLATPDWHRETGFHYIEPFRELAEFGLDGFTQRMMRDSLFYSVKEARRSGDDPQAFEAPLNYLGGPLTLAPRKGSVLPNVLRYTEIMATEFVARVERAQFFDRASTENAYLRKRISELELDLLSAREKAALQAWQLQPRTSGSFGGVRDILSRAKRRARRIGQFLRPSRAT